MPSPYDYRAFFREEEDNTQREYWGESAAGCIFVAKDTGRILIAHRSDRVDYEPETWGTWGGKIDMDESPKQAVEREVEEETGFTGQYKIHPLYTYRDGTFAYHNYLVVVPFEFTPQLNWENDSSSWVDFGDWPTPLHFGLVELIKHAGGKIQKVIDLLKKKKDNMLEAMDIPPQPPAHVQHVDKPAQSTNVVDQQKMKDAYVVVATLWGEARGEGEVGMQAVMNVVMNRAHGDFSKARKVVLKRKQFSIWNGVKDPDAIAIQMVRDFRSKKLKDSPSYIKALELVDKAMKGDLPDITGGATFYFNPHKVLPSWAKEMTKTKTIGNHDFYKPMTKAQRLNESVGGIDIIRQGLVDDGVFGYEMRSPKSFVRYGFEPSRKLFHLYMVVTPNTDDRNQGHSKSVLDSFFQFIKQSNGALDVGSYTGEGMDYVKPVVDRLAKQYGVRLV